MKQKEFDLRKALTGHPVKTRDGHKAKITGLTVSVTYPLLGVVYQNKEIVQHIWTIDGNWSECNKDSALDLVME